MTTPAAASPRFQVHSRLATARGLALVLVSLALAAGFVATTTAHGPAAAPAASTLRAS